MHGILKINLEKIKSNWSTLNKASNGNAAAVIKADSYGLGMSEIAKALIDAGCNYFYVANITEGINLRQKITSSNIKIAVFEGFFEGNEIVYFKNKLTPIINNLEQLKRINKFNLQKNNLNAILNIDTGMNRLGLSSKEINIVERNKDILCVTKWDFIMSHLTSSNNFKNTSNKTQLDKITQFSNFFPDIKLSLANTGGIKLGEEFCLDPPNPLKIQLYQIYPFHMYQAFLQFLHQLIHNQRFYNL